MQTQTIGKSWGTKSVSFWSVLVLALGIIFIGVRFIINPQAGAIDYGIPFETITDAAYGKVKGIRDIFSGIALLPLLWLRMRKATAWVFTAAIVVPVFDFLVLIMYNGSGDTAHLIVHGITALVMMITSVLLFWNKDARASG